MERTARRPGLLSDISAPTVIPWRAQHCQYIDLLCQKCSAFWTECMDAEKSYPSHLWGSFNELLNRGRAPPSADIKVVNILSSTADADLPAFTPAPQAVCFYKFLQDHTR